jgi:predicted peptidase
MGAAISGVKLRYLLHVPEGAAPDAGWPVVLFLHGAGERGSDLNKVKVHGPPKLVGDVAELKGAVVISPQCPTDGWWRPDVLKALLDEVFVAHGGGVDRKRVYCTGLSMGGYGTWSMIARYPGLFAAAVPICGGGDIERLALDLRRKGAPSFDVKQLVKNAKALPVWAFHGASDTVVPQAESELLVDALKAAGSKLVKFTSYPGVGHDSWSRTYGDKAMWKWLFERKR